MQAYDRHFCRLTATRDAVFLQSFEFIGVFCQLLATAFVRTPPVRLSREAVLHACMRCRRFPGVGGIKRDAMNGPTLAESGARKTLVVAN